ncbi:MAG: S41 family peptidase [Planctomycetota bacterium]|nr:MAG: S41 family peptidase [Planctomycetota bacterium]
MPKRNLAWILVIAMITLLMWQLPQTIAGRDAVYKAFGALADVKAQIRKRFVEDVDDEALTRAAVEAGIRAMVRQLHDPYAIYLNRAEYERFKSRTDGLFGGIGVDVWATPLGLEVLSRDPNSPAAEADILPGDIITRVNGEDVSKMPLVEAVNNLLNGPPGTPVTLVLLRPREGELGEPRELTLERSVIHLDPIRGWSRSAEGGWRFMLDTEQRIGYVRLTKFTHDAAQRLDEAAQRLISAGMRGLILDLRENTGGLLDSAREVADRFLETGLIVRVSGRRADEKQWFAMRDGTYPDLPMVVLINGSSASAAEIVAGALRDNGRAAVVGERSYGKGSVQEVVELDDDSGAIKLTTAYYYLPSGQCINRTPKAEEKDTWGVEPTVVVPMNDDERRRWLAIWREVGREVAQAPTTREKEPLDAASDEADPERAAAARIVLEGDTQLRAAVDILLRRLAPKGEGRDAEMPASAARTGGRPTAAGK